MNLNPKSETLNSKQTQNPKLKIKNLDFEFCLPAGRQGFV
jgi:hypothetical protein